LIENCPAAADPFGVHLAKNSVPRGGHVIALREMPVAFAWGPNVPWGQSRARSFGAVRLLGGWTG
jgi:hypothetical protein